MGGKEGGKYGLEGRGVDEDVVGRGRSVTYRVKGENTDNTLGREALFRIAIKLSLDNEFFIERLSEGKSGPCWGKEYILADDIENGEVCGEGGRQKLDRKERIRRQIKRKGSKKR